MSEMYTVADDASDTNAVSNASREERELARMLDAADQAFAVLNHETVYFDVPAKDGEKRALETLRGIRAAIGHGCNASTREECGRCRFNGFALGGRTVAGLTPCKFAEEYTKPTARLVSLISSKSLVASTVSMYRAEVERARLRLASAEKVLSDAEANLEAEEREIVALEKERDAIAKRLGKK